MYYSKKQGYGRPSYASSEGSADYKQSDEFSGFIGCSCQGTGCRGTCRTPKRR